MNGSYEREFLTLALIHLQAVMLPGPDFAVTISQSLSRGRRSGVLASLGIACGLGVHIAYTLAGVGLLLSQWPLLLSIVQFSGAAYLLWLAWQLLRSRQTAGIEISATPTRMGSPFIAGLLTNLLNPKVTLFFLTIFTTVISVNTPTIIQLGYGVWMITVTALWFMLVASLASQRRFRHAFLRLGPWMNRLLALLLVLVAVALVFSKLSR